MRSSPRSLVVLGVISLAAPSLADPPPEAGRPPAGMANVRLRYTATAGCPDRAAFTASVRARTPLARFDDLASGWAVSVTAESLPPEGTSHGTVHAEGSEPREVSAANCEDVVSALSLILALALDPEAIATSETPPVTTSAPVETPAPPPPAPPPAPVLIVALPPPPPPAPLPGPEVYWGLGAALSASTPFSSSWTSFLGPALSGELGARWTPLLAPSLKLGFAAGFSPEVSRRAIPLADFRLLRARLDVRPVRLGIGSTVTVVPYVGAELGSLVGEGVASSTFPDTARQSRTWLAVAEGAAVDARLFGPVYLWASVELREPLRRYEFVFELPDVSAAQVPAADLGWSLGAAARFW